MLQGWLADAVLVAHFAFVIFVSVGGLGVLVRPRWAALHVPCLLYGLGVELVGWTCPLTPLEQQLRLRAGEQGYAGGFVEHYVGGVLYPADWPAVRLWIGLSLAALNLAIYGYLVFRLRRGRPAG